MDDARTIHERRRGPAVRGVLRGGVYVSLHTNSPPTEANKIQDSWYSDVQEAANAWSEHDDGNFREVDNDSDIEFGTTPAAGALSDAEAVAIASASVMSAPTCSGTTTIRRSTSRTTGTSRSMRLNFASRSTRWASSSPCAEQGPEGPEGPHRQVGPVISLFDSSITADTPDVPRAGC